MEGLGVNYFGSG